MAMITLHNFGDAPQSVRLKLSGPLGERLVDLIADEHSQADNRGGHEIALEGYGYRWFRVGVADETLMRAPY
jgi:maltose alpha-D-glucosyltransferase/alpha-amylase